MEPMLAKAVDLDKLHKYSHYVMEPKLDGVRCVAYKDINGKVTLTSRGNKDLTEKVPHIVESLQHTMYFDMYLDGELGYWAGSYVIDFNRTMRVLGSGVDTALLKQEMHEDQIQYFVFDTPGLTDDACRRHENERRKLLQYWYLLHYRVNYEPTVVLVPRMDAFDMEWYEEYVEAGGEGVMLKNPNALYYPGARRANTWYKLKKFESDEATIVGYKHGQGKYKGMCGALHVVGTGQLFGVDFYVAGMDDWWRKEFWDNGRKYFGKTIEVKYFGLTAGTPRFPQFLRMRSDKDSDS